MRPRRASRYCDIGFCADELHNARRLVFLGALFPVRPAIARNGPSDEVSEVQVAGAREGHRPPMCRLFILEIMSSGVQCQACAVTQCLPPPPILFGSYAQECWRGV